jgi:hypothetical protein
MPFETFKIVYLAISILGSVFAVWLVRKNKNDLLVLFLMSFVMGFLLLTLYLDVKQDMLHDAEMMGYALTGLTHVQDVAFVVCNVLLWGVLPFAIGMRLRKKAHGTRLVWIFFISLSFLRTLAEDQLLIHQYPEVLAHRYEWGFVLFDWLIVYVIAALFITKGIESLTKE